MFSRSGIKVAEGKKLCNLLRRNMGKVSDTCQDQEYSDFYYLLKCYLETLPTWILVILIKNVSKIDFAKALIHHLSRFPRYLTKFFPERRLKH